MQYRKDKKGNNISILGYGCMRFTTKGGGIDIDKAEKEVMAAIAGGVNYLDTAYIYPGSEAAVGEILRRNQCRDAVNIATKLPHYLIKSMNSVEKIFQEELKRLKTDHIDYYLLHMLTDVPTWEKLRRMGMAEWIEKKLASGEIRNIGFSYHGNTHVFQQLVDAYDWDFCQIQYNYMDERSQAGVDGLRYANRKGLPVIIMEPLRGGRLVNLLPTSAKQLFWQDPAGWTPAALAFRWLYDQPEEFPGDGAAEPGDSGWGRGGVPDGGGPGLFGAGEGGDPEKREGGLHRLRVLHAVPQGGGHPAGFPVL